MIHKIYKIIISLATILVVIILNVSNWNPISPKQNAFESWLRDFELAAESSPKTFKQNITILSIIEDRAISYSFSPDTANWDSIFHILELIKDTGIFKSKQVKGEDKSAKISVSGYGESFMTSIPLSIAMESTRIQLLFKLLELNGKEVPIATVALNFNKDEQNEN
ncbi:MAG: hypothetical protein SGJ02_13480 [bacterium]|nr:hypothetical protein [bacterium]